MQLGTLPVMPVQAMTQQATRHARRVYVGGLPPTANEQENGGIHVKESSLFAAARTTHLISGTSGLSARDISSIRGDNAALVIYTSGTTGKPKDVVHMHRSVLAQAFSRILLDLQLINEDIRVIEGTENSEEAWNNWGFESLSCFFCFHCYMQ
ncbi:hypothetical protein BVRB_6g146140 isoform B [Beta vulgaris subsp. vulgaris]|nr:hypothetical protein BVRB_6g146140 isoform B [Beta vulgaris subsp. vulgaris]